MARSNSDSYSTRCVLRSQISSGQSRAHVSNTMRDKGIPMRSEVATRSSTVLIPAQALGSFMERFIYPESDRTECSCTIANDRTTSRPKHADPLCSVAHNPLGSLSPALRA